MASTAITMAHHSGRYDNMAIEKAHDYCATKASVIAHTEFGNDKRAKALKAAAKEIGWGFYQRNTKPYDECCFTWDEDVWRFVSNASTVLSDIPWYSGATGNQMPHFTAVAVFLEHRKSGDRWIFVTCHTPSHVAIWTKFRPMSNRIRCYQEGIKNLGRFCTQLDKRWKQHAMVVTADWNAPCEQKWYRAYLEKNFPRHMHVMGANGSAPAYPDTHDSRCIDWPVLGGNVVRRGKAVARRVVDSDHKTLFFSVARKR